MQSAAGEARSKPPLPGGARGSPAPPLPALPGTTGTKPMRTGQVCWSIWWAKAPMSSAAGEAGSKA